MEPEMGMTAESAGPAFWPAPPLELDELDIPQPLITDIVLRRLRLDGAVSLGGLRRLLKLPARVVESVCRQLQQQQLAEIRGMAGADYVFALTNAGRQLALDRHHVCQYAGPLPVSLFAYTTVVREQKSRITLNRRKIAEAFSDLVLNQRFLDRLGPALLAQKSLFLFGPTGNGKTSIAERIGRVYEDAILIPYAVEVDSQIIVLFDPVIHRPLESQPENLDPRYVLCSRPSLMTGGELTLELLELRMDPISKIYAAPIQMKANNGVLVIDDFGRQATSPHNLLNRWILPLDRRIDYLSLSYGVKFQIPFELMVVFSTNIEPSTLADEAFLRRMPNKVYVGPPTELEFLEIFLKNAAQRELTFDPEIPRLLAGLCTTQGHRKPNACHAADICDILLRIEEYEETPPHITAPDLTRAVELYFAEAAQGADSP